MSKKKQILVWILGTTFFLSICVSLGLWIFYMYVQVPPNIRLKVGKEQVLDLNIPVSGSIHKIDKVNGDTYATAETSRIETVSPAFENSIYVNLSKAVTMRADTLSSYQMDLKLFGIFPFKQVSIQVVEDQMLIPVGMPIGIYLETKGVLVIDIGTFINAEGSEVSPAEYILKEGDYIWEVNEEAVMGKSEFIDMVEESDGEDLTLTILRSGDVFDVKVKPEENQNEEYKLGIWVRDNAQGVGTMTFVDSAGNFGALGHAINDADTGMILEIDRGSLYETEIIAIEKGVKGDPGEMTGVINYSARYIIGAITGNKESGIFGYCNENVLSQIQGEALPIALKQDILVGEAQIICTATGTAQWYDIEIEAIQMDGANISKGIVIKVTDPDLIAITGGIVQGMSGSPIIQNGKLVGAVTHVLVNDPTRGYGIFIEEMIGSTG